MDELWKYAGCVAGIAISVLLPPLWAIVKKAFRPPDDAGAKGFRPLSSTVWAELKPYVALGTASALTSIVIVAFAGDKITTAAGAILAGYAWDSTLQKLK